MQLPGDTYVFGYALLALRVGVGASVLLKYTIERSREYPRHVEQGTFIYVTRIAPSSSKRIWYQVYKYTFHLRPWLALAVAIGLDFRIGSALLLISIVAEMSVLFRYHLVLLAADLCLLIADKTANVYTPLHYLTKTHPPLTGFVHAPSVAFVQVLLVVMYGASAWRKIQNGFTSGAVLKYGRLISMSKRRFPDHIGRLTPWLLSQLLKTIGYRRASIATIFLETTVAILLAVPGPFELVGCAIAALMQVTFTLLFPRTLSFFTVLCLSNLVLWLSAFR